MAITLWTSCGGLALLMSTCAIKFASANFSTSYINDQTKDTGLLPYILAGVCILLLIATICAILFHRRFNKANSDREKMAELKLENKNRRRNIQENSISRGSGTRLVFGSVSSTIGPGTQDWRFKENQTGINVLDAAAKEHDLAYQSSSNSSDRVQADDKLANKAWERVTSDDADLISEKVPAYITTVLMDIKISMGDPIR